MKARSIFSTAIMVALVVGLGAVENDAAARAGRHDRAAGRAHARRRAAPSPMLGANEAVRCSCTSPSSCPQIGTLAIPGHGSQPLYCNQLNGSENPGVRDRRAWFFQCVELANRWLVDSVGAPMIEGNADQMCGNADAASYDVHYRGNVHEPVPGDLLVWDGYTFGHVAVVTSVSASSIVFANQNYGRGGVQYPLLTADRTADSFGSPRGDAGWRAKCLIHPKNLKSTSTRAPSAPPPPGACARVSPAHDGKYCGGSRQSGFGGGDADTLYTCRQGTTTSTRCPGGCTLERVGRDDHCT
jgi:surface antigen